MRIMLANFLFFTRKVYSMFKKLSMATIVIALSGCSSLPFLGNAKSVINLEQSQIDQKSYAVAYSATIQSHTGLVKKDYDVHSFASGAKDWYNNRILVSVDQIKAKLATGMESQIHAYYSGVVFASELQQNFSRLSQNCWGNIHHPSLTQGIYDAMLDLQKGEVRSENDDYLTQGSEQLLKVCQ